MKPKEYLNYKTIKAAAGMGGVMQAAGNFGVNQGMKYNAMNSGIAPVQGTRQAVDTAGVANAAANYGNKGLQWMGMGGSNNVANFTTNAGKFLGNVGLGLNTIEGTMQAGISGYNALQDARAGNYYNAAHNGINAGLGAWNAGASAAALAAGNPLIAAPAVTANVAYNGTRALSDKYGMPVANANLDQRMAQWQKQNPYQTPGFFTQAGMVGQHMADQAKGIVTGLGRDAWTGMKNGWNYMWGNK